MKTGWEVKKLKTISNIFSGNSINAKIKKDKYLYNIDGLNYIATKDVGYNHIIDYNNGVKIPKSDVNKFRIAPRNTVLICAEGGSAGRKIGMLNQDVCFVNKLFAVNPDNETLSRYIYYYFQSDSFQKDFNSRLTGLIGGVSKSKFSSIEIPLPPLPEQKRIVAILDKAFSAIEQAKANTEQNLQNAKELFESYLQAVFENRGEDWEEKKLGEVCNVIGGGTPSKKNKAFYEGDIFWATVRDMRADNIINTEFRITKEAVQKSSTNIIPKDNIIIATRVGLGKVCIIQQDTAINQDLKSVIPKDTNKLAIKFLFRWLKSISQRIIIAGTGATVQGVKLTFIKSLIIPLPPFNEQKRIIQKLDTLSSQTQKLQAIYQQKLADLEELKKSLLQKAFNGELSQQGRKL